MNEIVLPSSLQPLPPIRCARAPAWIENKIKAGQVLGARDATGERIE